MDSKAWDDRIRLGLVVETGSRLDMPAEDSETGIVEGVGQSDHCLSCYGVTVYCIVGGPEISFF